MLQKNKKYKKKIERRAQFCSAQLSSDNLLMARFETWKNTQLLSINVPILQLLGSTGLFKSRQMFYSKCLAFNAINIKAPKKKLKKQK